MSSEVFMSPARSLAVAYQGGARTSSGVAQEPQAASEEKTATAPGKAGAEVVQEARSPAQAASEEKALDSKQLNEAVEELNDLVQSVRRELRFSVDEESGRSVISVIDSETEEIIRQIPPEQVVSLIQHFRESEGSLFQEKA